MIDGIVNVNVAGEYEVTYTVWDSSGNRSSLTLVFTVLDKEAPKFEGRSEVTAVLGDTLNPFALVTVVDNVDGEIELTPEHLSGYEGYIDETGKLLQVGTFTITYTVTDAAGNTGVFEVEVTVNPKGDTELVEDEVIYDILADQPDIDSGSSGFATVAYDDETGEARIEITDVGSWASYAKMKLLLGDLSTRYLYG